MTQVMVVTAVTCWISDGFQSWPFWSVPMLPTPPTTFWEFPASRLADFFPDPYDAVSNTGRWRRGVCKVSFRMTIGKSPRNLVVSDWKPLVSYQNLQIPWVSFFWHALDIKWVDGHLLACWLFTKLVLRSLIHQKVWFHVWQWLAYLFLVMFLFWLTFYPNFCWSSLHDSSHHIHEFIVHCKKTMLRKL